jgi:hypothetical protein
MRYSSGHRCATCLLPPRLIGVRLTILMSNVGQLRASHISERNTRSCRSWCADCVMLACSVGGNGRFCTLSNSGLSDEDEFEQLYGAGLTPFEALQAATSNAARFLGTTAATAIVSRGKAADLVLLDANPLDDVDNVFRQDGVMLRGRWFPFPEAELEPALSKAVSTENSVKR